MGQQSTPAGWYPDPHYAGTQRWWDGSQWTEHRHPPAPVAAHPDGADPRNDGLVQIGYLTAIIIPIVGLLIGLTLLSRQDRRGGGVVMLSLVIGAVAVAVLASGDFGGV